MKLGGTSTRTRISIAILVASLVGTLGGCSSAERSQASESARETVTALDDMPLDAYLKSKGVQSAAQTAGDLRELAISIVQPPNWFTDSSVQLPNTYAVIANTSAARDEFVPNATIVVHRLVGEFDAHEAIRRGPVDANRLPGYAQSKLEVSTFKGDPSSVTQGEFDSAGRRLFMHSRYVLRQVGSGHYVVHLMITTLGSQASALAGDIAALDDGLSLRTQST